MRELPIPSPHAVDWMQPPRHVVSEQAPLAWAVSAIVRDRVRLVPVVDESGVLVGTITDLDLLHWFARRRKG
jgi:CBS domain-containing protein